MGGWLNPISVGFNAFHPLYLRILLAHFLDASPMSLGTGKSNLLAHQRKAAQRCRAAALREPMKTATQS
jgi:hypothetical protein